MPTVPPTTPSPSSPSRAHSHSHSHSHAHPHAHSHSNSILFPTNNKTPPPRKGHLIPLRTKAQVQASDETVDVYICETPLKLTGAVLGVIRTIPGQDATNLSHLRRVVRREFLPEGLKKFVEGGNITASMTTHISVIGGDGEGGGVADVNTNEAVDGNTEREEGDRRRTTPNSPSPVEGNNDDTAVTSNTVQHKQPYPKAKAKAERQGKAQEKQEDTNLHILLCPTSLLPLSALISLLTPIFRPTTPITTSPHSQYPLRIETLPVPLHPPTNPDQSLLQSTTLWPTHYNPNNTYGPNRDDVTRAQRELEEAQEAQEAQDSGEVGVGAYMDLAGRVGLEASESGQGICAGVVVVERVASRKGRVVCVAGDGRWLDCRRGTEQQQQRSVGGGGKWDTEHDGKGGGGGCGNGNPAAHAVLRAIGLVALKRRILAQSFSSEGEPGDDGDDGDGEAGGIIGKRAESSTTATPTDNDDDEYEHGDDNSDVANDSAADTRPTTSKSSTTSSTADVVVLTDKLPASNIFHDRPLTPLERAAFHAPDTLTANGYLCLNLEVYASHEPCVMCCMALVHSRVGRVVFGRRMPGTGGLCADDCEKRAEAESDGDGDGDNEDTVQGGDGVERVGMAEETNDLAGNVVGMGTKDIGGGKRAGGGLGLNDVGRGNKRNGLRYGLFWRNDLNWRFLAWQWKDDDTKGANVIPEGGRHNDDIQSPRLAEAVSDWRVSV